jgi:tetratricopeptide (TPR) repeat protein
MDHRQALRLTILSEAHLHAGDLEAACTFAEQALELSRTYKERGNEACVLRLYGDITMQHEHADSKQAEADYQQALALADDLGMRPLAAHCHRSLGMLYRQTGQVEQARVALSAAIKLYHEMEMSFWLPETEAALAQVKAS